MLTSHQRDHYAALRIEVYAKFHGIAELTPYTFPKLLGYKDYKEMKDNFSPKDVSICRALTGPHAYTIYKMLLVREEPDKSLP